jgi:Mg2+ and Co2+ transporter CorA
LVTRHLPAILRSMNAAICRAARDSAPSDNLLAIKLDAATPFPRGVNMAASLGENLVELQCPDRSTARAIVARWEALVSLNQDLQHEDSREIVRVFRDVACTFGADVLHDVDGLPGVIRPHISRLEIAPSALCSENDQSCGPLTWTHIERPSKGAIEWAAELSDLDPITLERYLEDDDPCSVLRSSKCLVTRTYEIDVPGKEYELGKISPELCTMICGEGFLITLSREPASAIHRVWSDIENKHIQPQEYCSSGAIARLLLETALGQYQHAVEKLSQRIGDFWQSKGALTPGNEEILAPQAMRRDLRTCEHFALGFDDTLCKLEQREILAGRAASPTMRDSVTRTLEELGRSLTRCDRDIKNGESSWASLSDHWRNQILFKLAVLSGLCVPIGVWAGIGGMNFNNPLPDWILWGGLAVSALVSAGLVGGLIAGKNHFFKFMSGGRKEV